MKYHVNSFKYPVKTCTVLGINKPVNLLLRLHFIPDELVRHLESVALFTSRSKTGSDFDMSLVLEVVSSGRAML